VTLGGRKALLAWIASAAGRVAPEPGPALLPRFREQVVDRDVGCCYGLAVADVNRDGKPDIVFDTEYPDRVVWYENPTWRRRGNAEGYPEKPEPILPTDVDGDARVDLVAGGYGTRNLKIYWNEGK
jgi:hypothetical protein